MPDASTSCQSCIEQHLACSHARTCGSSAQCDAFWRCWLACSASDPNCQITCTQDEAGLELFKPLYADLSGTCATPCGFGAVWACAGHIVLPAAPAHVTETAWVYDYQSQVGVAGAQVSICTNCPCRTATAPNVALAQGVTDTDGYVTLPFTQLLSGAGQGSSVCLQVSAPGYLDVFAYSGFTIIEATVGSNPLAPPVLWGISLVTPQVQMTFNDSAGAAFDSTRAPAIYAAVFDCLGDPIPTGGAEVSISVRDPMMISYGAIDAGPDAWPSVPTGYGALGSNTGAFLNVPGDAAVTLSATVPGVGLVSTVPVAVAPGTVTEVGMPPSPSR